MFVSGCFCVVIVALASLGVQQCTAVPTNKVRREPHYTPDNQHNLQYDAEAFLGKDEAEEYKNLSPEESKRRLRVLCQKIDSDKDGFISHDELKNWVTHVSHRYVSENVEQRFPHHDKDSDGKVSFEEYKETTFGEIEDLNAEYDPHRKLTYKQTLQREEKKFKAADQDGNSYLDQEEFKAFLHPEEYSHMKDIVVDEAFEDMDKDKDGHITVQEYIDDIWPSWERNDGEDEPQWVTSEKEQFSLHRDKDGDKKLNRRELVDWISPEGFEHAEAEAKHLIYNADGDKDKRLSVDEVMDNHELFIGSQATDFGNYLTRHDEF